MTTRPPWLTPTWLRRGLRDGVATDLAHTDGHLALLADWDTGFQRLAQWLCYRIDAGTVQVAAGRQLHRATVGALVLIPAKTRFRSRCASPDGCRIARCRLALPPGRGVLCKHGLAGAPLGEIIALAARPTAPLQAHRVAGLLMSVLAPLLETPSETGRRLDAAQQQHLETWCAAHIRHRIAPADVAGVLGLSLDYCTRLFRATYGCAPRRWLLQQRLRHVAVALRESDATLDTIACSFGYADQNLMGRQFQRAYGCSPGRYRSQLYG